MARGAPLSDVEKGIIVHLHGQGRSLNSISAELGRSPQTVSAYAQEQGLKFDQRPTAAATQAKKQDNARIRAELAEWQYNRARRLAARLDAERFQTVARTPQGVIASELPFVPADDEFTLVRAISQLTRSAGDLEKIDAGDASTGVKSMLLGVAEGLRVLSEAQPESGDDSGE